MYHLEIKIWLWLWQAHTHIHEHTHIHTFTHTQKHTYTEAHKHTWQTHTHNRQINSQQLSWKTIQPSLHPAQHTNQLPLAKTQSITQSHTIYTITAHTQILANLLWFSVNNPKVNPLNINQTSQALLNSVWTSTSHTACLPKFSHFYRLPNSSLTHTHTYTLSLRGM